MCNEIQSMYATNYTPKVQSVYVTNHSLYVLQAAFLTLCRLKKNIKQIVAYNDR